MKNKRMADSSKRTTTSKEETHLWRKIKRFSKMCTNFWKCNETHQEVMKKHLKKHL